jgi:DNA-binding transcriptional regulator YbjK
MEHVVFFPAHDGTPAFRRVASLEDAVRLVEHLRNVEGVSEVSVHALAEVPLAFKTWYRVELPSGAEVAEAPAEEAAAVEPVSEAEVPEAADVVAVVPEQVAEMDVPVLASSNGRPADAPSSLGFFAS